MSKARYMRVIDKVRAHVMTQKKLGNNYLRVPDIARQFNVKEKVIAQVFSVFIKEGLVSQWRTTTGVYVIPHPSLPPLNWDPPPPPKPRKQKVSWGNKRRILTLVRKAKPWVIERWYEVDQRWWMYMERTEEMLDTNSSVAAKIVISRTVAPENQPDLTRTEIARWHFDMDGAIKACGLLRRQHPHATFRTRDTNAGDYLLGAIL
jgi:hypothetical protein